MNNRLTRLGRRAADGVRESQSEPTSWQRTLAVVWTAEFVSLIGFSMVFPFIPFYIQDLGVTDPDQVKFWSGLIVSASAVTMGIFAPIWGSLADRHGRKLMLERAMFGASAILALMAFVTNPQQLLVLRLLQGCLSGTIPAATTLIAGIVPRQRVGFALGWLQMGMYAGISVGPLVGGVVADILGFKTSFLITGVCLLLGGLGVLFFVHEDFERPEPKPDTPRSHWWADLTTVLRSRDLLIVLGARLLTRAGVRVIGPVLPLFVAALLPESTRVATIAGVVTGASAAASSIGSVVLGRAGDRLGYRRIVLASALAAAVFYILQAAVTNVTQLIILQFCVGLAMAGTIASLTALLATLAPEGRQGAVYGMDTSIVSVANAVGPILGASLAVVMDIRATFLASAVVFLLAAALIGWLLPNPQPQAEVPAESVSVCRERPARPAKTR